MSISRESSANSEDADRLVLEIEPEADGGSPLRRGG